MSTRGGGSSFPVNGRQEIWESEVPDAPKPSSARLSGTGQIFRSGVMGGISSSNFHGGKDMGVAISVTRSDAEA